MTTQAPSEVGSRRERREGVVETAGGSRPAGRSGQRLVRQPQGARARDAGDAGQVGHRADRPIRVRQVDLPADPQPDARAGAGRDARRRGAARRRRHLRPGQRLDRQPAGRSGWCSRSRTRSRRCPSTTTCSPGSSSPGVEDQRSRDDLVEECLTRAGSGTRSATASATRAGRCPAASSSASASPASLAVRPQVLLMDEPCSALDPTSTRRIEETIAELGHEVTIVIVTHNMQQAQRVSRPVRLLPRRARQPGRIVEPGPTAADVRRPARPPHGGLRPWPLRLGAGAPAKRLARGGRLAGGRARGLPGSLPGSAWWR